MTAILSILTALIPGLLVGMAGGPAWAALGVASLALIQALMFAHIIDEIRSGR